MSQVADEGSSAEDMHSAHAWNLHRVHRVHNCTRVGDSLPACCMHLGTHSYAESRNYSAFTLGSDGTWAAKTVFFKKVGYQLTPAQPLTDKRSC